MNILVCSLKIASDESRSFTVISLGIYHNWASECDLQLLLLLDFASCSSSCRFAAFLISLIGKLLIGPCQPKVKRGTDPPSFPSLKSTSTCGLHALLDMLITSLLTCNFPALSTIIIIIITRHASSTVIRHVLFTLLVLQFRFYFSSSSSSYLPFRSKNSC